MFCFKNKFLNFSETKKFGTESCLNFRELQPLVSYKRIFYEKYVYESSTTYLLTRLPHAGLHKHNGRQIELFHMKRLVDRSTGPSLMSL